MGDMLKADIDALHALGDRLASNADTIGGIKHTVTVTMPDSAISVAAVQASVAALAAYRFIGRSITQMAEAANVSATTYEAADHAFAENMGRYLAGDLPE